MTEGDMALWSSIRFSLRILRKHWKLTSIAIFSFAIAMAAGAVGFSVFNTGLMRPPAVSAPHDLWKMILRQATVVTAAGVCWGTLCGVVVSTLVRSQVYGIRPVEWIVFFAVALTVGGMTVLTGYSAARPWMRADPMESVRHA
jgi:hypothetical protein